MDIWTARNHFKLLLLGLHIVTGNKTSTTYGLRDTSIHITKDKHTRERILDAFALQSPINYVFNPNNVFYAQYLGPRRCFS